MKVRRSTAAERVYAHLFELGFIDIHIESNRGYWSHAHQDVCRWEGCATRLADMRRCSLLSWDKMPECARRGITVEVDGFARIEVFAKPLKKSSL